MSADKFDELRDLVKQENESLWAQGDLMVAQHLTADEMVRTADVLRRSVKELRQVERVAREFTPDSRVPRVPGVPWTVYAQLTRVHAPDLRYEVWGTRPPEEWTFGAMREAVDAALRHMSPRNRDQVREYYSANRDQIREYRREYLRRQFRA